MSISSPWYGLLAGVAFVIWLMQRRRRHRVPGGPIIHRAELEQALLSDLQRAAAIAASHAPHKAMT